MVWRQDTANSIYILIEISGLISFLSLFLGFPFSISIFGRIVQLQIAEEIFNFGKSGKAGKALSLSFKSILEYFLRAFFNLSIL